MKLKIDLIRRNGEIVYRTIVQEMSPSRVKTKAGLMLNVYAGRGATSARISNDKNEVLYDIGLRGSNCCQASDLRS
jgi:hypothetical protein